MPRNDASNIVPKNVGVWERSGSVGFEPRQAEFNIGKGAILYHEIAAHVSRTIRTAEGILPQEVE